MFLKYDRMSCASLPNGWDFDLLAVLINKGGIAAEKNIINLYLIVVIKIKYLAMHYWSNLFFF